ncbi:MAG TPA: hypothetical protein DEP25_02070 [Candidatus Taylorbacteria bacterium]|nr:hypothetical protein [Candidatus Taylorbacteria bacterium]
MPIINIIAPAVTENSERGCPKTNVKVNVVPPPKEINIKDMNNNQLAISSLLQPEGRKLNPKKNKKPKNNTIPYCGRRPNDFRNILESIK